MIYGQARTVVTKSNTQRNNWKNILSLFAIASIIPILSALAGCAGLPSSTKHTSSITSSFQLNPATVNFGQVAIGKQTTQTVTVTNTGNVAVSVVKLAISDTHFVTAGVTAPMTLAVGQSSNFTISVNPTAAGALTGTLTAQGDAGSTPAVVNLSATGISAQPQLSLNQAALNFGNVSTGVKSTDNLVLTNTGASNLTISLLALTGTDFSVSGITTPTTLTPGQSAQVAVSFSPAAAGSTTGNLNIASNDPVNPTTNVALSGIGTTAPTGQLNASASNVSFGSVAAGSKAEQQIMLTNTGNKGVTISSITVAGAGLTTSGVEVPGTLNPAESAPLRVAFAPAGGPITGSITVVSNAANSPLKIHVTGTAAEAGLTVSPSTFNFGSVVDGQTKSQTFTVSNTGTAALTIAQLSASGSGYTLSGLATPVTVAAGSSTTFSVLFAPTTAGYQNGTVSLVSNSPNSPNVLPLSGTGTAASVTLSANPASLSFANINAGSSSSKSITISNTGNTSVTISQVSVSAKDFSVSGMTTPFTLASGQTAPLNVAFRPSTSENVTGSITVASTQGASTVIAVSGTGLQSALNITPPSASFGNVTQGSPASQTFQLQNTGTGTLSISQVSVTGSGFSIGNLALPITLTPGQASNFNVQFNPAAAGTAIGSVSIVSNAPNSPAVIALSGTGVVATQALTFSTTNITFGNVNMGSSATQNVTLTDSGNANVTISQISESGAGFSVTGAGTPITLSAGQSTSFNVLFNPATAGSNAGTVTVTSTAPGSPKTIVLSGTGVQLSHSVTLSWSASSSAVSGYNVYRTTVSGSGYSRINPGLIRSLNYTDTTVQPGATYYYVATAVDASGNESTDSNQATAVIP